MDAPSREWRWLEALAATCSRTLSRLAVVSGRRVEPTCGVRLVSGTASRITRGFRSAAEAGITGRDPFRRH